MKRNLRHATLALAVALLLAVTGCSSGGKGGSASGSPLTSLSIGSPSVTTLNYDKSNYGYYYGMGDLILEPLLAFNPQGKIGPWLADSWSQPNSTTYLYHLRSGAKFSDGTSLTAADVVFSLDYYRAKESLNAFNFPSSLKSIQAVGNDQVKMTFTEPDVSWNSVLAGDTMGIFEKSFYLQHKSTFGQPGTGVVGTGPWKLDSFDSTSGAEFSANQNYWGGKVPYANIHWNFFSSETNEAVAFRTGQINVAFPTSLKAFAATASTKLVTAPGKDEVSFWMNTSASPWSDIHVRRAVSYALSPTALINAAGGYGTPVQTFLPPLMLQQLGSKPEVTSLLKSLPSYPSSVAKAKAELAKSAYPNGTNVTLAALNEPDIVNVSQAVVSELAAIGIHAKIKVEEAEANNAELTGSDRQAIHSQVVPVGAGGVDPGAAFSYALGSANATTGNWNATNWSTPEVDKLVAQGMSETDATKRLSIYGKMLKAYAEGAPWVPLYTPDVAVAVSSSLQWPGFNALSRGFEGPWPLRIKPAR